MINVERNAKLSMKFFISYSHADEYNKLLASLIQNVLIQTGNRVYRDLSDLFIKDNIPLFIAHIQECDKIIAIIDDSYFYREACMKEIEKVYQKDKNFSNLFTIIVSKKQDWVFNTYDSISKLNDYWDEKIFDVNNYNLDIEKKESIKKSYLTAKKIGEILLEYIKNYWSMRDNQVANNDYNDFLKKLGINDSERIAEAYRIIRGNNIEDVEIAIDRYKESNPKFFPAYIIFSRFYHEIGRYKQSNRLLEVIPDYSEFKSEKNFSVGLNMLKQNDPIENAIPYLIKGLEINSDRHLNNSILFRLIANRLIKEGILDQAIYFLDKQYEILLESFKQNRRCPTEPLVVKGYIQVLQNKTEQANECFEKIANLSFTCSFQDVMEQNRNKYYAVWGLSYLERGTENSQTYAKKAIEEYKDYFIDEHTGEKISPNLADWLQGLALNLERFKLFNESINCWMVIKHIDKLTVGKKSNEYISALNNLILLLKEINNIELATKHYKEGLEILQSFKADSFLQFQFEKLLDLTLT